MAGVGKKTISATIKESTYNKLKDMGIPPTSIVGDFLELYITEMDVDAAAFFKAATIKEKIKRLDIEIQDLEFKKELRDNLKRLMDATLEEYKLNKNKRRLRDLILKLDKIIIMYNYDIEKIQEKYVGLLKEIKRLDSKFELLKRINSVKLINEGVEKV